MNVEIVVPGADRLGESPFWDAARGVLWWCDITGGILHRHDPSGGDAQVDVGAPLACAVPRASGGLVAAMRDGFHALDERSGETSPLAAPEGGTGARFNDACTDRQGRLLAGAMAAGEPEAGFHTLHRSGRVSTWSAGHRTCNGLAISPDGRRLYFSDSRAPVRTIWSAPYDPETGEVGARELFLDTAGMPGRPDGACVDADGCYWSAAIDGAEVIRVTPSGRVDRRLPIPTPKPTKPCWGGARLDTLYVTSLAAPGAPAGEHAGALFAVTGLGASGLADAPYGG